MRFIKTSYDLSDDFTKVLVGAKLKEKALEWFHSRSDYIEMPLEELLVVMKGMFDHRPAKITLRKQFEERRWRRDEAFAEYCHEKVILGNRVPVADEELIDYIIDGIPSKC